MIKGYAVLVKNEVRHFYADRKRAAKMAKHKSGQVWKGIYSNGNYILLNKV